RAGPAEKFGRPLKFGSPVFQQVSSGARNVALIQGGHGAGHRPHRRQRVTVVKKNLLQRSPSRFFQNEGAEFAEIGNGLDHGKKFLMSSSPLGQRPQQLIGFSSALVAIDLEIET